MKLTLENNGTFSITNITIEELTIIEDCLFAGNHEGFSTESSESLRKEIEQARIEAVTLKCLQNFGTPDMLYDGEGNLLIKNGEPTEYALVLYKNINYFNSDGVK